MALIATKTLKVQRKISEQSEELYRSEATKAKQK